MAVLKNMSYKLVFYFNYPPKILNSLLTEKDICYIIYSGKNKPFGKGALK